MKPLNKQQELTLLQEASNSRASLFPKQGREEAKKMIVTSGRRCLELFQIANPNGSSLKMLVEYLLLEEGWYSSKCALIWKEKVTKPNRLLFQLVPKMRRTEGIGSGLLPTSRARDSYARDSKKMKQLRIDTNRDVDLVTKIEMLPTPTVLDGKGRTYYSKGDLALCGVVKLLPTPRANKHTPQSRKDFTPNLAFRIGEKVGLKLQPNFVEWMMGFPQNWTDLNCPRASTEFKG